MSWKRAPFLHGHVDDVLLGHLGVAGELPFDVVAHRRNVADLALQAGDVSSIVESPRRLRARRWSSRSTSPVLPPSPAAPDAGGAAFTRRSVLMPSLSLAGGGQGAFSGLDPQVVVTRWRDRAREDRGRQVVVGWCHLVEIDGCSDDLGAAGAVRWYATGAAPRRSGSIVTLEDPGRVVRKRVDARQTGRINGARVRDDRAVLTVDTSGEADTPPRAARTGCRWAPPTCRPRLHRHAVCYGVRHGQGFGGAGALSVVMSRTRGQHAW